MYNYLAKIDVVNDHQYDKINFARNKSTGYLISIANLNQYKQYNKVRSISTNIDFLKITIISDKPLSIGDKVLKGNRIYLLNTSYELKNAKKNKLRKIEYSGKNIPSDIVRQLIRNPITASIHPIIIPGEKGSNLKLEGDIFNENSFSYTFLPDDLYQQIKKMTTEIVYTTDKATLEGSNISDSYFNSKLTEYLENMNHLLFRSSFQVSESLSKDLEELSKLSIFKIEDTTKILKRIQNELYNKTNKYNFQQLKRNTMIKMEFNGNLGEDPKMNITTNKQIPVANFSLAHNDKSGGPTQWQEVTAWGDMAKYVEENFKKGDWVAVDGTRKDNSYQKDGKTFHNTVLNANAIRTSKEKVMEQFEITNVKTRVTKNQAEILELYGKNKEGFYSNFTITSQVNDIKDKINLGDKLDFIGKPRASTYFEQQGDKKVPKTRFDCTVTALVNKEKDLYFVIEPPKIAEGQELPVDKSELYQLKKESNQSKGETKNDKANNKKVGFFKRTKNKKANNSVKAPKLNKEENMPSL
jgi:single-stranded DNA-binding protein